ncbi:MAG: DUF3575 domain-containing protein [Muribaculaceae bacterium]|nr:DUF3575 domain-containing protein [Muribaculaceae bacterium]
MKQLKRLLLLLLLLPSFWSSNAQTVGIKTNLIPDAALSPNLGVEVGLAQHWSVDFTGELNLWPIKKHYWKHWLVQPEVRYWLCDKFAGHFFGLHVIGGQFNVGNIKNGITFLGSKLSNLSHYRYQGWGAGAGIAYGYDWILGKHWNLEAEIGIGWIYTRFDQYSCATCGKKLDTGKTHNYVGPTKLSLALEYIF